MSPDSRWLPRSRCICVFLTLPAVLASLLGQAVGDGTCRRKPPPPWRSLEGRFCVLVTLAAPSLCSVEGQGPGLSCHDLVLFVRVGCAVEAR